MGVKFSSRISDLRMERLNGAYLAVTVKDVLITQLLMEVMDLDLIWMALFTKGDLNKLLFPTWSNRIRESSQSGYQVL